MKQYSRFFQIRRSERNERNGSGEVVNKKMEQLLFHRQTKLRPVEKKPERNLNGIRIFNRIMKITKNMLIKKDSPFFFVFCLFIPYFA